MSKPFYKVRVQLEPREDGGLRAWSPDVPQLVLSALEHDLVFADIQIALTEILSERFGRRMAVDELVLLPVGSVEDRRADCREYAARPLG